MDRDMAGRGLECHVQGLSFSINGGSPGSNSGRTSAALCRWVSTVAWLPLGLVPLNNPRWGVCSSLVLDLESGAQRETEKFDSASCASGPSLILMSPSKSHLLMRSLMVTD